MKLIEYITNYFLLIKSIELTPAEAKVLMHLCNGLTTKQISLLSNHSINTIRKQISSLHDKFNVNTTSQLIIKAMEEATI